MPSSLRSQVRFFGHFIKNKNFWLILATDILLIVVAHAAAYMLRFPDIGKSYAVYCSQISSTLPLLILIKIPIFYAFGLYRGMWRYTSLGDLVNIVKASTLSLCVVVAAIVFINRFNGFPRSIFFIDALL